MMKDSISVLIVDDHPVVREGLHMLLSEEPDIEVVGEAADGDEAVRVAKRTQPDVVLMDLVMPEMDGVAATRSLRNTGVRSRVLVLTSFAEDDRVRDAIQAGAVGYLLKDVRRPELLRAIRAAADGQPTLHPDVQRRLMQRVAAPVEQSALDNLTDREREVLRLLAQGYSNKQIAGQLHLSEGTVKWYVSAILTKLDVDDRTQAALYAVKHGIAQKA
jgi:DNA-binding NarL/FixJ family response regulator